MHAHTRHLSGAPHGSADPHPACPDKRRCCCATGRHGGLWPGLDATDAHTAARSPLEGVRLAVVHCTVTDAELSGKQDAVVTTPYFPLPRHVCSQAARVALCVVCVWQRRLVEPAQLGAMLSLCSSLRLHTQSYLMDTFYELVLH